MLRLVALVALCFASSSALPSMKGDPCKCPVPHGLDCSNATLRQLWTEKEVLDDLPPGTTSKGKLDYYWGQITADTASKGYMNPLKTLLTVRNESYLEQMWNLPSETMPKGHQKSTHGSAGHAKVHFEWKTNEYTGMFQKADNCVIRITNAAKPSKGGLLGPTTYNPNMAIKCYRDAPENPNRQYLGQSANLLSIWEIDGYDVLPPNNQDSCSFFDVPLSNHCSNRDNITAKLKKTFIPLFERVDPHSCMLGTSPFATSDQEGKNVDFPNFPFALVYQPAAGMAKVACKFDDYFEQLDNVGKAFKGKAIYEVYAVKDPWDTRPAGKPDLQHIGSMILDDGFTTSMFGDTELFFRHRFMNKELSLLSDRHHIRYEAWKKYSDPNGLFIKEEGAAWYQPFLPKADSSALPSSSSPTNTNTQLFEAAPSSELGVSTQCSKPYQTLKDGWRSNANWHSAFNGTVMADQPAGSCRGARGISQGTNAGGGGWFRFEGQGGDALSLFARADDHCGTDEPGYLSAWNVSVDGEGDGCNCGKGGTCSGPPCGYLSPGRYPTAAEGVVEMTACFDYNGGCGNNVQVAAVQCDGFLLFRLPYTPNCYSAYCTCSLKPMEGAVNYCTTPGPVPPGPRI